MIHFRRGISDIHNLVLFFLPLLLYTSLPCMCLPKILLNQLKYENNSVAKVLNVIVLCAAEHISTGMKGNVRLHKRKYHKPSNPNKKYIQNILNIQILTQLKDAASMQLS